MISFFLQYRYGREEYRCDMCPYTCTTEKAFLKHLRGHSSTDKGKEDIKDVPRLSCPVCGKDRTGEAALNKHMQRHRNDKNFCCDICSFKTVQLKKVVNYLIIWVFLKVKICNLFFFSVDPTSSYAYRGTSSPVSALRLPGRPQGQPAVTCPQGPQEGQPHLRHFQSSRYAHQGPDETR